MQTELMKKLERPENFGPRLSFVRRLRGESQISLSQHVNVSSASIGHYENKRVRMPSDPAVIGVLCNFLKVKQDWLLNGKGEPFEPEEFNDEQISTSLADVSDLMSLKKSNKRRVHTGTETRRQPLNPRTAANAEKIPFIERCRQMMTEKNLSVRTIADKLGVSTASVNRYLNQNQESPKPVWILALASLFEVNAEWLGDGSGERDLVKVVVTEITTPPEDLNGERDPHIAAIVDRHMPSPADVVGDVGRDLIAKKLREAIDRRNLAQADIDEWTMILVNQA